MSIKLENIAIFGASGAIGSAISEIISKKYGSGNINLFKFSRHGEYKINYNEETSICEAAELVAKKGKIDLVVVANGMLHDNNIKPEKSLKDLSEEKFCKIFKVNTVVPALIAKYFLPKMHKDRTSIFSVISARVGSISDNRIGGWYAYRASKAALNMVIKNASIEVGRTNRKVIVVGLHPGTVDSKLSKPFQKHVLPTKLFTPQYSGYRLLEVLSTLKSNDTGKCFSWDGKEILP